MLVGFGPGWVNLLSNKRELMRPSDFADYSRGSVNEFEFDSYLFRYSAKKAG